ncbi:MAG: MFS transporter [Anaerofustis sp.]
MKKPLSKALKVFYGVGDFGFTLMSNVELYCFSYFLTNIVKFDLATTAFILTFTSLIDAILSPFYGGIMNSVNAMKWGRYRSWLVVIPPLVALTYTFQFTNIGVGIVPIVIICVGSILGHILWNFSYVANIALIPVMSSTPEDRAQLTATRGAWNNASKIVFSYVGLTFALWMGTKLSNPVLGFTLLALIMSVVYVITYFAHFKMSDGYEKTGEEAKQSTVAKQDKTSLKELFRALFQNPHLLVLLLADLARWLVNFVMASTAAYFFRYVINSFALFSVYLLIANICAMVGAFLSKYAAAKLSTRTASIIGFFALGVLLFCAKFAVPNATAVIVLLSCAQFFLGFIYSLISAMYSDSVIYSQWKTGKNASGWIMGLMNLPLKVANLIKGAVIPIALAAAGFAASIDPAAASQELKDGITTIFITVPATGMIIGAILLLVGYKLTRDKINTLQKEINEATVN